MLHHTCAPTTSELQI